MKVLHVNYSDSRGGAGSAVRRLHEAMRKLGVDSRLLAAEVTRPGDGVEAAFSAVELRRIKLRQRWEALLCRFSSLPGNFMPRALNLYETSLIDRINALQPDVVCLHWINGAMVSIEQLPRIEAPVAWVLHDTWPFCGTEHHHRRDDLRFLDGYDDASLEARNFRRKQDSWQHFPDLLIGPSHWITGEAKSSLLFRDRPCVSVPNGLDTGIFRPGDRNRARDLYKIDRKATVIAVGAANLSDPNKGGALLRTTLHELAHRQPITVLAIGAGSFRLRGVPVVRTGWLSSDKELAHAYQTADLFLHTALYDNLPYMPMEAIACGVPVAAFQVGGVPDIVVDEVSGRLAEPGNCTALADAAVDILSDLSYYSPSACEYAASTFASLTTTRRLLSFLEKRK